MLFYCRRFMSIIKVTLRYAILQICSSVGQSVFDTPSLKLAKTVATKTACTILYTCLTCVSSTVFLYCSDTLVTYQNARCYNTHDHNQGRIQAQADQAAAQGGRFEGAASKLSKLPITTTPFHSLTERYSMNVDGNFN